MGRFLFYVSLLFLFPLAMKKLLYLFLSIPIFLLGQEQDPCYSINEVFTQIDMDNPQIEINLVSGWNMIGYPCTQDIMVSDGFSSIVNKITIVKNNNGNVYMPEFNFNGIGFLEGGQGYQIKMTDFVLGFTFCQSIQFPTIEGCTDCDATNFNQWANVDDGSCNYDSDGDGIVDSLEVIGCQDSLACNYNEFATDLGECNFAEQYFNCDGTPQIGAYYQGGILFYLDETSHRGLVVSTKVISYYNWGCYDYLGADGTAIGTGYQNTLDIVFKECDNPIYQDGFSDSSAAEIAYYYEFDGYDDWFLPSKDELTEVHNLRIDSLMGSHWTSSEYDSGYSWQIYTGDYSFEWSLGDVRIMPKNYHGNVLPIRAFGNWTMGCMDSLACNYNSEANMADESCTYAEQGYDCDGNIIAQIGDIMEGGYLFYVDSTGQHGLVAAMEDLPGTYPWGCRGTSISGAEGTSIGVGHQNTLDIVEGCSETPISASESLANESGGYSDWFLPSIDELVEMYNTIGNGGLEVNIGGFENSWYWSSSEASNELAWRTHFSNGYTTFDYHKNNTFMVRVIRTF